MPDTIPEYPEFALLVTITRQGSPRKAVYVVFSPKDVGSLLAGHVPEGGTVTIEVTDTMIGVPTKEMQSQIESWVRG
jgi:hypothetical protein